MQKVVGSNPISRFARKPALRAGFRVLGRARRRPLNGSERLSLPVAAQSLVRECLVDQGARVALR